MREPPTLKGVSWRGPTGRRAVVSPLLAPSNAGAVVDHAEAVEFDEPLPDDLHRALAEAMADRPEVSLGIGTHFGLEIDQTLSFLSHYEALEEIAIGAQPLRSIDGVRRLPNVKRLSVSGWETRFSLDPLRDLPELERLDITWPAKDYAALSELPKLRFLFMTAAKGALEPLAGHPSLDRLILQHGTERDLSPLSTLPVLRDLSIWQIQKLTAQDLEPVGRIPRLEALQLGALRNVDSLAFLEPAADHLRYLELELVPALASYAPLALCRELRALVACDARPADKSLAALTELPALEDVTIADVYAAEEIASLVAGHPDARIGARGRNFGPGPSRAHWRSLLDYVDERRAI